MSEIIWDGKRLGKTALGGLTGYLAGSLAATAIGGQGRLITEEDLLQAR